jgi:hypothetical protein
VLFLQPLPERRPPAPNAWGLSLVSKTLGLHPKVEGAKPSDSTIFQLNICPCSSKAERSPCKRQVAGALPRLGLHFSAAPAEAIAALIAVIYAHVVYWMGNVLLKRLKQVRFLPCAWCAIAQLVSTPVKWIVPGSSPGSAAIFHYRLTVRHSAHDWTDVGANPASGTIFFMAILANSVYLAKIVRQLIANQSCDGANPSVHFIPVSSNGLGRSPVTGVMRIRIPSLVPIYGDDPAR